MPFSPLALLALIFLLSLLLVFIQLGLISITLAKLGLSPGSAVTLLLVSVTGSLINLPLFKINAEAPLRPPIPSRLLSLLRHNMPAFTGQTTIAMNVGGCMVPIIFSLFLLLNNPLPILDVLLTITIVSAISYFSSRPIPGIGIGMPFLVAPLIAAAAALLINPGLSAPLAYIGGTLGVLIGADLLRLKDIRRMGTPLAAIGGAGTFDGIFITGIVAVLLA